MARILVRCSNKECKQIMYIDDPEYPPKFEYKNNILMRIFRFVSNLVPIFADEKSFDANHGDHDGDTIIYTFGCSNCGELNSVDLPINGEGV